MKIAVVTGANKGIGNGIVRVLADKFKTCGDWIIYLTARDECRGVEAVKELEKEFPFVKFHQLDINDKESRDKFARYLETKHQGQLKVLVNNAGIAYKMDSTAPFGEQAEVTIATNYTATVQMCLEFLPLMGNNARLVNVSSLAAAMSMQALKMDLPAKFKGPMSLEELNGLMQCFVDHAKAGDHGKVGFPNSAYGMSKLGLCKATAILAKQYESDRRRILINSCCPGYVDTDMTSHKGHKTILEGADTPCYLATLPDDATEPHGQFLSDRKIFEMDQKVCP